MIISLCGQRNFGHHFAHVAASCVLDGEFGIPNREKPSVEPSEADSRAADHRALRQGALIAGISFRIAHVLERGSHHRCGNNSVLTSCSFGLGTF